jgi:hypothetical protein
LTWYMVCGCIVISYRSSLRFVPVQWFLAELWPLDFEIWPIFSCHPVFRYVWRYWLDFWYISVKWWVKDQVYISFRSNDFWPSHGPWTLKFGQIFSCHHFFWLCMEILTWFLVWECIIISYRSSLKFVPVEWSWPAYNNWALKFGQIFCCHHFISLWFEILTWFLVWLWECI